MNRAVSTILALSLAIAAALPSSAQTDTKYQDFNSFSTIKVSGGFEVSVRQGYGYNVSWTFDTALADYVEVYVKNKVLTIEFNQKGMPSALKKVYRGKNGRTAMLKAVVTAPEFSALELSDNAVLEAGTVAFESDNLSVSATGDAKITSLVFNADKAKISLSKSAIVSMDLNANEIEVVTSDKSILSMKQDSDKLNLSSSGSSSISSKGNSMDITVNAQNSSKVLLDGQAKDIVVNAQNSSEVDAVNMFVNDAELSVNSAMVLVNAAENLSVDLKGGAKVYFQEDPLIKLVDISSSSLSRYTGEVTRKRPLRIF